jgi:acyl-coenzyme A thioesterase PaaI-like protein
VDGGAQIRAGGEFSDNDYCFACGSRNPMGLNLHFFAEGEQLCTRVKPLPHWQGFEGILHGGIQAAILDDLMSNHLFRLEGVWVATAGLELRYRKPVPLNEPLLFRSSVTRRNGRQWWLQAVCHLEAWPLRRPLTEASGRFIEVARPAAEDAGPGAPSEP